MKVGIYLGDIKNQESLAALTFEMSFVDELLNCNRAHEFVFYYFGNKDIFKNKSNARFVRLNYFTRFNLKLFPFKFKKYKAPIFSFNYILKKHNINVVCFLTPYLFENIEIPYFSIIRNVSHRVLPHFPEYNINNIYEKKLNLFLRNATKIITSNMLTKTDIKTLYDVIDENINIIPMFYPRWVENCIDSEKILRNNSLIKNNYILYPAQYWSYKNHIRLILSALVLKEQNINLKIVFCGIDKGNRKYLKDEVERLDLQNDIIFLDYVSKNELSSLYKNAYAMVCPSLAGTDSIVSLEAMYFGCPVLISNYLGYRQQLKNAALYFNPLDETDIVEKIKDLNNLAIKDELINKGKHLINENNCKNYIDNLLNLLDNFYLIRQCWSLKENYKLK